MFNDRDLKIFKTLNFRAPYVWIATWFGAGFFRPAPGTWGSLASIPFAIIIFSYFGMHAIYAGIILITVAGLWSADKFDKATGGHDNKMIVIDEAAGQWIALIPAFLLTHASPLTVIAAFLLFRLFDIIKPWPISWLDKNLHGARGVMFDDIVAGIFAALCLTGLIHYAGFS